MPQFLFRRNVVVATYPDEFLVLLLLDDGYELNVGYISKQVGTNLSLIWAWACPGNTGREETLGAAMAAFRVAWRSADDDIARRRIQQETSDRN